MKLLILAATLLLALPAVALAANCSVTPSPAAAGTTVTFHADHLNGDNYLYVCGPYADGFSAGCPGFFDLGFTDPVDIPYTLAGAGVYTFTVAHEHGASYGNIGQGYIQCQVTLDVF